MNTAAMSAPGELDSTSDDVLADRLARGEHAAFEQLIALYGRRVTRLVHRLTGWSSDVDDIVQDVFVSALRHCRTFRRRSSLWTWLTAIAVNRCRSWHRRQILRSRLVRLWPGAQRKTCGGADQQALEDEVAGKVRAAVAALPARDREAIVLFYFEQHPTARIAQLLGVSSGALNVRLHRARAKLRHALQEFTKD